VPLDWKFDVNSEYISKMTRPKGVESGSKNSHVRQHMLFVNKRRTILCPALFSAGEFVGAALFV
jgi:hypothetical protein